MKFKSNFFHLIEKINYLWNLTQAFNKTALIHAVFYCHKEIAELLISQEDIDINMKDILKQKHS